MKITAIACILAATTAAQPLFAHEVTVSVDARSGPWSNQANRKMRYGKGDEAPPATVAGFVTDVGARLDIYPAEGATIRVDGRDVPPSGIVEEPVDDMPGPGGKYYPSLYTPKVLYPANRHALIGVFVDDKGVLAGRPFVVGNGVRVTAPDGATHLNFGYNDVTFKDSAGALVVTVSMPDE